MPKKTKKKGGEDSREMVTNRGEARGRRRRRNRKKRRRKEKGRNDSKPTNQKRPFPQRGKNHLPFGISLPSLF